MILFFNFLPCFIRINIALGVVNFFFYILGIALKIIAVFAIFASFASTAVSVYFEFAFSTDDLRMGAILLWAIGFLFQNGRRVFVTQVFIPSLKNHGAVDRVNKSLGFSYLKRGQERLIVRVSLGFFLLLSVIILLVVLAWIKNSLFYLFFAASMILCVEFLMSYSGAFLKRININVARSNVTYLLVGVWGLASGLLSAITGSLLFSFNLGESHFAGFLVAAAIFISACQLICVLGNYKLNV